MLGRWLKARRRQRLTKAAFLPAAAEEAFVEKRRLFCFVDEIFFQRPPGLPL
jgi:hypothetical protein